MPWKSVSGDGPFSVSWPKQIWPSVRSAAGRYPSGLYDFFQPGPEEGTFARFPEGCYQPPEGLLFRLEKDGLVYPHGGQNPHWLGATSRTPESDCGE